MPARPNTSKLYVVVSSRSDYNDPYDMIIYPLEVRGVYDSLAKANQVARDVTSDILENFEREMPWSKEEIEKGGSFIKSNGLFSAEWTADEECDTHDGGYHFEVQVMERVVNDGRHEGLPSDKDEDEDEEQRKQNLNRLKQSQVIEGSAKQRKGRKDGDDEVQFVGMGAGPSNKRQRA